MKAVMKFWFKSMGAVTAATALLCLSAAGAAAARPDKEYFSGTGGGTNTSLCGFPIEVSTEVSGFTMFFSNQDGDLVRIQAHVTAQDTFSANGVTLVGEPYKNMGKLLFSDDELVEFHISGVLEKVRLPDGSTFMGAGRIDVLAAGFGFVVDPDSGVVKNQDAFCAALSG